jgi:SAM-dependent methyltransferase
MTCCPICASVEVRTFFHKSGQTLLICRNCRHVWWERLPPESELAAYYREQYTRTHTQKTIQSEGRNYYQRHLSELLGITGRRPGESRILDYGCSVPVLLQEADKLSFEEAIGVDYARESKEFGRRWRVRVLFPAEIDEVPNASLDIVRFSHIIEHCVSPLGLLRDLLPKLKVGGLVYITQPNFPVFQFQESARDLSNTVYPEHLHFFSPISLLEMTRRLNVSVFRFFSHQNEAAVISAYEDMIDLDYARERLADYADRGDRAFPPMSNYPYYAGENSAFYGFKRE